MLFNIMLKVKYRFMNLSNAINNSTFLSQIDCINFLINYFHNDFILLLCASIYNTKFCIKVSIRILCNQKLLLFAAKLIAVLH